MENYASDTNLSKLEGDTSARSNDNDENEVDCCSEQTGEGPSFVTREARASFSADAAVEESRNRSNAVVSRSIPGAFRVDGNRRGRGRRHITAFTGRVLNQLQSNAEGQLDSELEAPVSSFVAVAEVVDENYERDTIERQVESEVEGMRQQAEQLISLREAEYRSNQAKMKKIAFTVSSLVLLLLGLLLGLLFGIDASNKQENGEQGIEGKSNSTTFPSIFPSLLPSVAPTELPMNSTFVPTFRISTGPSIAATNTPVLKFIYSPSMEPSRQNTTVPTKAPISPGPTSNNYDQVLLCASRLSYATIGSQLGYIQSIEDMSKYIDRMEDSPQHFAVQWLTKAYAEYPDGIPVPGIDKNCKFGMTVFADLYALIVVLKGLNSYRLDNQQSCKRILSEDRTCICENFIGVVCSHDNKRIIRLNFQEMALQGEIPGEIQGLVYLTDLNLSNNPYILGTIGWQVARMNSLVSMDISNTNISGNLSMEWGNLSNLNTLDMSSTRISGSIPSQWENMNSLNDLNISDTDLTGVIPDDLCFIPLITADCLDPNNGQKVEMICSCCKFCCADGLGCQQVLFGLR